MGLNEEQIDALVKLEGILNHILVATKEARYTWDRRRFVNSDKDNMEFTYTFTTTQIEQIDAFFDNLLGESTT